MSQHRVGVISQTARSNWILLRTLVMVRWIAIAGQITALLVASVAFDLSLPLGACVAVIAASVLVNIFSTWKNSENRRLTETETVLALCWDVVQLSLLIALTGGLNNPFALLVIAPVTVAATVLQTRRTALLGAAAIFAISIAGVFHMDLIIQGSVLKMPILFVFGFWAAIVTGVVFISIYARRVTGELNSMAEALLATQMALAREQKLTDLGGVVAATAHELGTPLATIKLVSSELMSDLPKESDHWDDAQLIREQADRCSKILRSMGRAGKDDTHLKTAPLESIVHEAAEPHMERGISVNYEIITDLNLLSDTPYLMRKPEIIHGLRNLIQNAVDFSNEAVMVRIGWDQTQMFVEIIDDGTGFASDIIPRLGTPFIKKRRRHDPQQSRPEYEGMGLGLFIAKTLLERSGAELEFSNDVAGGACVRVTWPESAAVQPPKLPKSNPNFTSH